MIRFSLALILVITRETFYNIFENFFKEIEKMKKTKKVFSLALSMLLAFTPVSGLLACDTCAA